MWSRLDGKVTVYYNFLKHFHVWVSINMFMNSDCFQFISRYVSFRKTSRSISTAKWNYFNCFYILYVDLFWCNLKNHLISPIKVVLYPNYILILCLHIYYYHFWYRVPRSRINLPFTFSSIYTAVSFSFIIPMISFLISWKDLQVKIHISLM